MSITLHPPVASPNNEILPVLARQPGTAQQIDVDAVGQLVPFSSPGAVFFLYAEGDDVLAQSGHNTLVTGEAAHLYERGVRHSEVAVAHATHIWIKARTGTAKVFISELA